MTVDTHIDEIVERSVCFAERYTVDALEALIRGNLWDYITPESATYRLKPHQVTFAVRELLKRRLVERKETPETIAAIRKYIGIRCCLWFPL